MNNIRISIDLLKLEGTRQVMMTAPNGKKMTYIAIPTKALFVPKDGRGVYITATMVPAPNALYGDFMIKPYIDSKTYANMSRDERYAVPVIGKGTYMEQQMSKEARQQYETVEVEDVSTSQPDQQTGGVATSPNAQFPAESGKHDDTTLIVRDTAGNSWPFTTWNDAAIYAETTLGYNATIEAWRDDKCEIIYRYSHETMQWEGEYV
jgi:hypothetical protein